MTGITPTIFFRIFLYGLLVAMGVACWPGCATAADPSPGGSFPPGSAGSSEEHPVPRAAPRKSVRAEPLANRSSHGVLVCDAEVAAGLKPLDAQAITTRCPLPFTLVPEEP